MLNPEQKARAIAAAESQLGRKLTQQELMKFETGGDNAFLGNPNPTESIPTDNYPTVPEHERSSIGAEYQGGQEDNQAGSKTSGTPGTWETAMMAVAKTVPSIIDASRSHRGYAPAANVSGRRAFDIPSATALFGKNEPGFQSLLARLLMGR
jgi:hypothetical protein